MVEGAATNFTNYTNAPRIIRDPFVRFVEFVAAPFASPKRFTPRMTDRLTAYSLLSCRVGLAHNFKKDKSPALGGIWIQKK